MSGEAHDERHAYIGAALREAFRLDRDLDDAMQALVDRLKAIEGSENEGE